MAGNIWILSEQWRGNLSEITFELLVLGREIADGLGVSLEAVLLGHQVKDLASKLGAADTVLYADHPALAEPMADALSKVLADLVEQRQPHVLLVPWTNVAADLLGLLPARLDAPFLNACQDVSVADGRLQARCLLYGGKMEATVIARTTPAILGVLPGARLGEAAQVDRAPAVQEIAVTLAEAPGVRFRGYLEPETGDVDITQQDVLISVGRGVQSEDNVEVAEELAAELGGAVCGSRPVIDQGWLPLARQVGKSGAIVKPKLYIAAGISGAPEHVEGMKDSELIIAINTDPGAPIFAVAHYGAEEDATDVLPALLEAVRARKG
jgi:electron transfer flavoprotein alpha subunit